MVSRLLRLHALGLRTRITVAFALGAALLSAVIAVATLALTRENLLETRDETSFTNVTLNANRVLRDLPPEDPDPEAPPLGPEQLDQIVSSLSTSDNGFALLRVGELWQAGDPLVFNETLVPASMQELTAAGQAARMRTSLEGRPASITGIPIPGVDAVYYQAVLLDDVEEALGSLGWILLGVGGVTTALGAGLGFWAARRILTPLADVRRAASALAAGELDTRVEPPADHDLASLAASFNEMAGALEDRIERDARFASEVSHELRSPLMTLNASLEVLENRSGELSETNRTALELLSGDVERFTRLVEDLLEISRYDVGSAALQAEPVLFAEFVRQAVDHSVAARTEVVTTPAAEETVIDADKRRLAQVVANLVENAVKYGEPPFTVTLDCADGVATMAVEDHGAGVPPEERAVIFDRFSRGSAGGRRGGDSGSGLGLSLVAEHVGLHGGRVWVDDRGDGDAGARFVVELPIREDDG